VLKYATKMRYSKLLAADLGLVALSSAIGNNGGTAPAAPYCRLAGETAGLTEGKSRLSLGSYSFRQLGHSKARRHRDMRVDR
jgi:hypothetical protein